MKNTFVLFALVASVPLIAMESSSDAKRSLKDVCIIPGMPRQLTTKYLTALQLSHNERPFAWGNGLLYAVNNKNREAFIIEEYAKAIILKTHEKMGKPEYQKKLKIPGETLKDVQAVLNNDLNELSVIFNGKKTLSECKEEWERIKIMVMGIDIDADPARKEKK